MSNAAIMAQRQALLRAMGDVQGHVTDFKSINKRWDGAITAGMIETGRMQSEAAILFGPLIQDMGATKGKFVEIQDQLVEAIVQESVDKIGTRIIDRAKFAIDIVKRNLFERTADVGYLSTDSAILDFLRAVRDRSFADQAGGDPDDERIGPAALTEAEARREIEERLTAYQYEYTVYSEILILDTEGFVRAHLDQTNRVERSRDPLLGRALAVDLRADADPFVETYHETDLLPGRGPSLIYSQKIEDPRTRSALGVLCLVFDFEGEMEGIYKDLLGAKGDKDKENHEVLALLSEDCRVISSSDTALLPIGTPIRAQVGAGLELHAVGGTQYLMTTCDTLGYEGFVGLPWQGFSMVPLSKAFLETGREGRMNETLAARMENFAPSLSQIKHQADGVLGDMKLDGLNGQVKAAQHQADGFVEVLRFVNTIGDQINEVFSASIQKMQSTIVTGLFDDLAFRAFQANNIADRNLYERANDVCWWALTPRFRRLLHEGTMRQLTQAERTELTENLQYINDLYTPYLRLVLADTHGKVLAVSNPPEGLAERLTDETLPTGQAFVGRTLDGDLVRRAVSLPGPKDYVASEFQPTPLYGGRPTYVYSTAVRAPGDDAKVVGVIQIVFDAEPQFVAMLEAALPKEPTGEIVPGAVGLYLDAQGKVIASTAEAHPPGSSFKIPESLRAMGSGERRSLVHQAEGKTYVAGGQLSEGYREYKRSDGYVNDVLALILVPV